MPATLATYVLGDDFFGCNRPAAKSPSFVRSKVPLVWKSRRPTGTTRAPTRFKYSATVGRPSGSLIVLTTLRGL
jgi:hypothetical protein